MLITSEDAPHFRQGGVNAVGYASPSRGARELSLWRLSIAAGERSPAHTLDREEVFLALDGSAVATIAGEEQAFAAGDCLVVPAHEPFVLVAGDTGLEAVCAMPAGGRATLLPDGPTITPQWAA
jgi:mannose-6-phosphate isomerase-like protein (cupin superfamily)